jgi:hypothetical protein
MLRRLTSRLRRWRKDAKTNRDARRLRRAATYLARRGTLSLSELAGWVRVTGEDNAHLLVPLSSRIAPPSTFPFPLPPPEASSPPVERAASPARITPERAPAPRSDPSPTSAPGSRSTPAMSD